MVNLTRFNIIIAAISLTATNCSPTVENRHPNVVLIITDDQGYGDLGVTGNPHVKTPAIDQFAGESIRFNQFYVSPVCAPTRSSLMTGRYSLRTGVRDTYNGGAIMATEEVTMAEILKEAGYSTGIFGKWHLGDSYPSRPDDQGFDESLIHLAGGMGQPGDITTFFRGDSSYFDPVLWHNGSQQPFAGYCSDIFADAAISFIEQNQNDPFFCYLSFNAPHTPLQVPEEYYNMYKDIDPSSGFENDERPFPAMSEKDKEDARKVYGMITNIDDNVGKLLQKLDELNIAENTIVIFMTDNGPQQRRYNAGLRGLKGSVFRGGVRVPFYWRLPSHEQKNKDIETTTAHIDLLPTLAELCGAEIPADRSIDGKSLLPLLNGEDVDELNNRPLFFYWTRRHPELYNNIALQKGNFRLVGHTDYDATVEDFELFNIREDEYEQHNLISSDKALAAEMKEELDRMVYELTSADRMLTPPGIIIGSEHENPVILNRNDASGERAIWTKDEIYGYWKVKILEGRYDIRFKFIQPVNTTGTMYLETSTVMVSYENDTVPTDLIEMKDVYLPDMECDLIPYYASRGKSVFPFWVELTRR